MATDTCEADVQSATTRNRSGGIARNELGAWLVVGIALVADLVSTVYGVQQGLTEGNPVVRSTLARGGVVAFAALKLGVVCLAGLVWAWVPRRHRLAVPLGLALPWGGIALLNVATILA